MLKQLVADTQELISLADSGYVYAIVDASADSKVVTAKAGELGSQKTACLFEGMYMAGYDAVAPYLFAADPEVLAWSTSNLDPESWGVWIFSKTSLDELVKHLQRFLLVVLPDNRKWFFRYYDPRILRAYLRACNPAELREFFGPVRGFGIFDPQLRKTLVLEYEASSAEQFESFVPHPSGLWLIRPEQLHELNTISRNLFVSKVAAHLREFFPEESSRMDKDELYQFIHYGVERAASCGIGSQRHVCQYIGFMFAFGKNFDQDPEHGWVGEILRNSAAPSDKIDRLRSAAGKLLAGKGTVHA